MGSQFLHSGLKCNETGLERVGLGSLLLEEQLEPVLVFLQARDLFGAIGQLSAEGVVARRKRL